MLSNIKSRQTLKLVIYVLLLINFVLYIIDDIRIASYTLQEDASFLDWTQSFATTIDESAWLILLFLFELETYMLSDEAWSKSLFTRFMYFVGVKTHNSEEIKADRIISGVDPKQTFINLVGAEKRPFFLENAGQFSVGNASEAELFFSRKIGITDGNQVPIDGGVRLSGKVNDKTNRTEPNVRATEL